MEMTKIQVIMMICGGKGTTDEDKLETIRKVLDSKSPQEVAEFCFARAQQLKDEYLKKISSN